MHFKDLENNYFGGEIIWRMYISSYQLLNGAHSYMDALNMDEGWVRGMPYWLLGET